MKRIAAVSLALAVCGAALADETAPTTQAPAKQAPIHLRAGPKTTTKLFDEIAASDRELFAAAFDSCDADKLVPLVTDDLEFFHDKDGLSETSGAKFVADIRAHCERIKTGVDFRARRELVADSLRVYPLNNYGAVETGIHRFFAIVEGKPDQLTETSRFLHIWKQDNGRWKLARVVSYDHELADEAK